MRDWRPSKLRLRRSGRLRRRLPARYRPPRVLGRLGWVNARKREPRRRFSSECPKRRKFHLLRLTDDLFGLWNVTQPKSDLGADFLEGPRLCQTTKNGKVSWRVVGTHAEQRARPPRRRPSKRFGCASTAVEVVPRR